MSVKVIDVVGLLVDQIHKGGYQQRALEDDIYAESQKRVAAEKDRDHWRQARQDAIQAGELMQAEIETLRGAMAADDQRLRDAEERVWPGRTLGCDAPDAMADEILHLRQQLSSDAVRQELEALKAKNAELLAKLATVENAAVSENETLRQQLENANRELSEQAMVSNVEAQQDAAAWQQQVDSANAEVKYLRDRLDEERSVSAGLREKLTAAEAAVSLQRAGIERLQAFVGKVRSVIDNDCDGQEIDEMIEALGELDAETSEPEGGQ